MVKVDQIILGICLCLILVIQNAKAPSGKSSSKLRSAARLVGNAIGLSQKKKGSQSSTNNNNSTPSDGGSTSTQYQPSNDNFVDGASGAATSLAFQPMEDIPLSQHLGYARETGIGDSLSEWYNLHKERENAYHDQQRRKEEENARKEYNQTYGDQNQGLNAILLGETEDGGFQSPDEAVINYWNSVGGVQHDNQDDNDNDHGFPQYGFEVYPYGAPPPTIY